MSIRAIYFDLGGVLIRTVDRQPRSTLAQRLQMTDEALEELVFGGENGRHAQLGKIPAEEQWAYVCQQVGWPLSGWRDLRREFFAGDRLDADLVSYIRGLHGPYKTGVISNALSEVRAAIIEQWHLADAFDAIILSAEVGVMKPDPRIFHLALQALHVKPNEAVFVDDFIHNVVGAQSVGMQAIHFQNPEQMRRELISLLT